MQLSPGYLIDKLAIHRSKTQFNINGTLSQTRNMFEQPLKVRGREICIDHQPCTTADLGRKTLYHQTLTLWRATPTLPDNGIMDRQPRSEADGSDGAWGDPCLPHGAFGNMSLRGPDFYWVMFDPPGLWANLAQLLAGLCEYSARRVEDERASWLCPDRARVYSRPLFGQIPSTIVDVCGRKTPFHLTISGGEKHGHHFTLPSPLASTS